MLLSPPAPVGDSILTDPGTARDCLPDLMRGCSDDDVAMKGNSSYRFG
jgi:hypothetical protein